MSEWEWYVKDQEKVFKDIVYSLKNIDTHEKKKLIKTFHELGHIHGQKAFSQLFPPGQYHFHRKKVMDAMYHASNRLTDDDIMSIVCTLGMG